MYRSTALPLYRSSIFIIYVRSLEERASIASAPFLVSLSYLPLPDVKTLANIVLASLIVGAFIIDNGNLRRRRMRRDMPALLELAEVGRGVEVAPG